jgi:hypothetical protein
MTAPSIRLADGLKSDATAYARGVGVSLNALVAIAVRDYLDARKSPPPVPTAASAQSAPARAVPAQASSSAQKTEATWRTAAAKLGRNAPCPCGSGSKVKQCHGGAL